MWAKCAVPSLYFISAYLPPRSILFATDDIEVDGLQGELGFLQIGTVTVKAVLLKKRGNVFLEIRGICRRKFRSELSAASQQEQANRQKCKAWVLHWLERMGNDAASTDAH